MGHQFLDLTRFSSAAGPYAASNAAQGSLEDAPRAPAKKLKKFASGLNVRRPLRDRQMWERLSLPIEAVFGASAHPPQAPIWLDPSGCPPGRVFRFWR